MAGVGTGHGITLRELPGHVGIVELAAEAVHANLLEAAIPSCLRQPELEVDRRRNSRLHLAIRRQRLRPAHRGVGGGWCSRRQRAGFNGLRAEHGERRGCSRWQRETDELRAGKWWRCLQRQRCVRDMAASGSQGCKREGRAAQGPPHHGISGVHGVGLPHHWKSGGVLRRRMPWQASEKRMIRPCRAAIAA